MYKITLDEVEEGLMAGPFSREEIEEQVGDQWIAARRFGLKQENKIRPIDNFAEYMVNDAFGSKEKVELLSVDHVVAWGRAWLGAISEDGTFLVKDNQGATWYCKAHTDWTREEWRKLRGRITDLANAYKQVPASPKDKALGIIAVQDPDSFVVNLFRAWSLMFGETAAVYAFLRISRALSTLAARLFDLVIVEFFDDFTQLEADKSTASAWATMEAMLKLLGWDISMKESKRKPFAEKFETLGVAINFHKADEEMIEISNKAGRLESIECAVEAVVSRDKMGFKEALSIKGKVGYAEGQFYGRVAAPTCRLLSKWASAGDDKNLTDEMRIGLVTLMHTLLAAKPRLVKMIRDVLPIVIFTDGACEKDGTSIGGILFEQGCRPLAFGAMMCPSVVKAWATKMDQVQVIGQAEIFPVLVARHTWKNKLAGRRVLYFIDNDSARLALVKSYSPVLSSLKIICECASWDCIHDSVAWYARVPTGANIADGPSRMSKDEVVDRFGAEIVKPVLPSGDRWVTDVL